MLKIRKLNKAGYCLFESDNRSQICRLETKKQTIVLPIASILTAPEVVQYIDEHKQVEEEIGMPQVDDMPSPQTDIIKRAKEWSETVGSKMELACIRFIKPETLDEIIHEQPESPEPDRPETPEEQELSPATFKMVEDILMNHNSPVLLWDDDFLLPDGEFDIPTN